MLQHLVPEEASYDDIRSVVINKAIYHCNDIVVVGGHIGNIERIDIENNECQLGLSFEFDQCMKDPEDWEMYSGHQCSYDGIRHATDEEKKNYDISSNLVCDASEAADIAWKERWIKFY